jgi:hypothetical protein
MTHLRWLNCSSNAANTTSLKGPATRLNDISSSNESLWASCWAILSVKQIIKALGPSLYIYRMYFWEGISSWHSRTTPYKQLVIGSESVKDFIPAQSLPAPHTKSCSVRISALILDVDAKLAWISESDRFPRLLIQLRSSLLINSWPLLNISNYVVINQLSITY